MKNKILKLLNRLPLFHKYYSGLATVFMLHRVHPFENERLFPNENMKVTPEFLENFIVKSKAQGYRFISLDRLYEMLIKGQKIEKQIVLTLDDGYKDNYTIAYPIFKKYNVPFAVYITTSFPEKKAILWWYELEDLIVKNEYLALSNGMKFICDSKEKKERVFLEIREIIISLSPDRFLTELNKLFFQYNIDWYKKCNDLCLTWDQIIELSSDDLCTIANHTVSHPALNKLTDERMSEEIIAANELIELKLNKQIKHFSYPFGSINECNKREFDFIKNQGFKTATTTRHGNIHKRHGDHLECMPRIMLTEGFSF